MGYLALLFALTVGLFTLAIHEESRLIVDTAEMHRSQDAGHIARQMLSLSQAFGHWRYSHPDATVLPDVATLGLPFTMPDSRVQFALISGRLWVWTEEALTPGVTAQLRTLLQGSGLLCSFSNGLLRDMAGQPVSTAGLTLPPALLSTTGIRIIHLN